MAAFDEINYSILAKKKIVTKRCLCLGQEIIRLRFPTQRKKSVLCKPSQTKTTAPRLQKKKPISTKQKMLRRKPTSITLTAEDLASYEDRQAREALLQAQLQVQAQLTAQKSQAQANRGAVVTPQRSQNSDPKLTEDLRERRVRTREERLGLGVGPGLAGRG
jgi:Anaphase-promoting complex APC subunit CDC26